MYAVIETGGKQYRVEVGTELEVELLDVEPGDSDHARSGPARRRRRRLRDRPSGRRRRGASRPRSCAATAADKLISFKYRPKARSRVKKGHRQELTVLRITDVELGSKSAADDRRKAEAAAKTERERLEEAAAKQAAEDAALAAKLAKASAAKAPATKAAGEGRAEGPGSRRQVREGRQARRRRPRPRPAAKADPKTTRAKTQSGAADAKPASAKPKAPRTTKKDE